MNRFQRIVNLIRPQLFAAIPPQYQQSFDEHLFMVNTSRFATQSIVLVAMDVCSLTFYLLAHMAAGSFSALHLAVRTVKMALMLLCFYYFLKAANRPYRPTHFTDRNVAPLYAVLHVVLEAALYFTGPQTLGSFIRLLAVPFVAGSIPILRQRAAFALQTAVYLGLFISIPLFTPYSAFAETFAFILNLWVVVYACAILVSFTVYSWAVNRFVAQAKEVEATGKLAELNARLEHMAHHDALTGLFNRRGFQQFMDESWDEHVKTKKSATVIMLDIDFFKLYNDRFGHVAGDSCLHHVTGAIDDALADTDYLLARYGGEEFIVVAYDQNHAQMVDRANQMRKAVLDLELDHPDSEAHTFVTISLGIATQAAEALENYTILVDWADECLYFAKRSGRNRVIHTEGQRGDFKDIHGVRLVRDSMERSADGGFDDAYTQQMLRDVGVNSSFVYDGHVNKLWFSSPAVHQFDLPSSVAISTVDELAEQLHVANEDKPGFVHTMTRCLENRDIQFSLETRLQQRAQAPVPVFITAQCSYDGDGQAEMVFGSIVSVTKMTEYSHYLRQQSQTNNVTLLPNRNKLAVDLKALIAQPEAQGFAIFMDIRDFKGINSYYSHSIGDKVLRETALNLSRLAGDYGPVYNYDVDQFMIVAQNASRDNARALMDAIYRHFDSHHDLIEGLDLHIDLSIVALPYTDKTDTNQLFVDVDAAGQMMKYNSYEQYAFFDGKTKADSIAKIELGNALKKSVENNFEGFLLHYQPIIDAKTNACVGCEALLRWRGQNGELVPPTVVVPILEKSDLMVPVEGWLMNTACAQCHEWIVARDDPSFFININLSAGKIGRATLYNEVFRAVEANGLTLKNITLEVTESSTLMGRNNALATLSTLYKQGVHIAIDDFGTGYSSLSYLNALPANKIKIDRSFVDNIDTSDSSLDFLSSIVAMVKSMGYLVCIEGVERPEQDALLRKEHIDYLQGYLYGMPTPGEDFFDAFLLGEELDKNQEEEMLAKLYEQETPDA